MTDQVSSVRSHSTLFSRVLQPSPKLVSHQQAQRFFGARAVVCNPFNIGRHLVSAKDHRMLRMRAKLQFVTDTIQSTALWWQVHMIEPANAGRFRQLPELSVVAGGISDGGLVRNLPIDKAVCNCYIVR